MNNTTATTKVTKDVLLRKMSVQLHEVLRKFAKDNGAHDNFVVKVQPDEKVEFSWEIDKKTFLAEDDDATAPEPQYDSSHRVYRVATGEVQVGDLGMFRDNDWQCWYGPAKIDAIHFGGQQPFLDSLGGWWRQARHLTDEERAQIKRI